MEKKALSGVRVADFGWVLAEPYGSMLLAHMGAEVIKIESRAKVDEQRVQGGGTVSKDPEASSNFFEINMNKLSVTLNLKSAKGIELAKRIVSISDVATENMRPGVMNRLGLGYEDLRQVKPDIIMLSLSGYGGTGPLSKYAAYAPCFSCFSGQAFLTGYADGVPNTLTSDCDARAGTMGAFAILMALLIRDKTGQGQHIDLSSSEALNMQIGDQMMEYSMNGRNPKRCGNRDAIMAPHNTYRCKGDDAWISIAVGNDAEWNALCRVMGDPEWTKDEAFSSQYGRWQNQDKLDKHITEWTMNYDYNELMADLQNAGVAAIPSFKAEDLFTNPHLLERGAITKVHHPVLGDRRVITPPWKFSETPATISRVAPLLGEHNEYVFGELLGMSTSEMKQLMDDKIIF